MTEDRVLPAAPTPLVAVRLGIALIQGVALYFLFRAARDEVWPATDPYLYIPAALSLVFVPLIVISGYGHLRVRTLIAWKGIAVLALVGLGLHAADRVAGHTHGAEPGSFSLWVFTAAGLFIAHALILAGDADRRLIARYGTYFDFAWTHIIQVALAAGFVGAFWLLFALANALFRLINIDLLDALLERAWFVIPTSTLVMTFALHMTDVRAGIVRGLRNLGLTLLSWLLVMMTALMVAFLFALLFTGLAPLWGQKSATALLLICAASLIVLINAAYQDGARDQPAPQLMRLASWAAAVALLPMVALAAYALFLRVAPYGFTPDRVVAAACVVVAAAYALGYSYSLHHPGRWLGALERTNLGVSGLILVILLALFTPVADPTRISVADQIRRLEQGKVTAEAFDYNFLRFHGARYGMDALKALAARKDGPNAALIAQKADEALKNASVLVQNEKPTATQLAQHITVYPAGKELPPGFLAQDWKKDDVRWMLPCTYADGRCDAYLVDLDGAGLPEVILAQLPAGRAAVFQSRENGAWTLLGFLNPSGCAGMLEALRAGAFKLVQPELRELEINGRRLHLGEQFQSCDGWTAGVITEPPIK